MRRREDCVLSLDFLSRFHFGLVMTRQVFHGVRFRESRGLVPVVVIVFGVLVGLAEDCADAGSCGSADDGSFEAAAEDCSERGTAGSADESSLAGPYAALIGRVLIVVVVVAVVRVMTAVSTLANAVVEVLIVVLVVVLTESWKSDEDQDGTELLFYWVHLGSFCPRQKSRFAGQEVRCRFFVGAVTDVRKRQGDLVVQGFRAVGFNLPMRPLGPTTKGRDRAFQFWSASGASEGEGFKGCQFLPSSVEMSVPLGPTVIQVFAVGE